MSEEEKTGTKTDPTDEIIERSVAEILAENRSLVEKLVEKDAVIKVLTDRLQKAEAIIDEDVRSKKIGRIQKVSTLGIETLSNMSAEELARVEEIYKHVKLPTFKSSSDTGVRTRIDAFEKLHNMYAFNKKEK